MIHFLIFWEFFTSIFFVKITYRHFICLTKNLIILIVILIFFLKFSFHRKFSRTQFFRSKDLFFKKFLEQLDVKMKFSIITRNLQSIQLDSFEQYQFYDLTSSQRPPASVGLNVLGWTKRAQITNFDKAYLQEQMLLFPVRLRRNIASWRQQIF